MPQIPILETPRNVMSDPGDESQLRHGREVHKGFTVGKYLQTPPFFFTRDKLPVPLIDRYRGSSAFLIASGPSFAEIDKNKLDKPGILTMGINNSVKTYRPDMWISVDNPANFIRSIWLDSKIEKFVPISHIDKPIFNSDEWKMMNKKVGDCPNCVFYKRNEKFIADQYLWEDTINWGNHTNLGGGRTVMLAAIKILFLQGIRNIFLLGVDFNMSKTNKYHFDQDRSKGSIGGNNSTYKKLNDRFKILRPIFEEVGLNIYNCNPESALKAFDFMSFDDAYTLATHELPDDLENERTEGLYDRKAKEKEAKKKHRQAKHKDRQTTKVKAKTCDTASSKHINQVKNQVKQARIDLHEAKELTAEMKSKKEDDESGFNEESLRKLEASEQGKRVVFRRLCSIRDRLMGRI